jgi:branched-chain amino acid transport system permease protein
MTRFADLVAGGVLSGALVALLALGISLIYRTTGILNLSQGAMAAAGAYVCYAASKQMPMMAAMLLAIAVMAVVGALVGVGLRNLGDDDSAVVAIIATLAVGIVIGQVIEQIWGSTPLFFPNVMGLAPVRVGPFTLDRVQLYGFVVATALAVGVAGFLRFTPAGLRLRAVAESTRGARLCGVQPMRMRLLVWAMAAGMAAVAGVFIASLSGILTVDTIDVYLVAALLAAVIGGLGSLPGTIAGAALIWTAKALFQAYAPNIASGAHFVSLGGLSTTFLFAFLIAILWLRPRGLFGGRQTGRA